MAILAWITFNVVIPLLALPFTKMALWLSGTPKTILRILKDGQLCFFSAVLSAVTIYDVSKELINPAHKPDPEASHYFIIGLAAMILPLMIAMGTYAIAAVFNVGAGAHTSMAPPDAREASLGWISIAVFITTVVSVLTFRIKLGAL